MCEIMPIIKIFLNNKKSNGKRGYQWPVLEWTLFKNMDILNIFYQDIQILSVKCNPDIFQDLKMKISSFNLLNMEDFTIKVEHMCHNSQESLNGHTARLSLKGS